MNPSEMKEHALFHINVCTSTLGHCVSFHVSVHAFIWGYVHTVIVCVYMHICVCMPVGIHVFWGLTHHGDGMGRGRAAAGRLALRLSAQSGSQ